MEVKQKHACGYNGITVQVEWKYVSRMAVSWNSNGTGVEVDFTVEIRLKEVALTSHHNLYILYMNILGNCGSHILLKYLLINLQVKFVCLSLIGLAT